MVAIAPPRSFVPATLDAADFAQLEPLYQALLDRPLDTSQQAERWLADFSELTGVVEEYRCRRYIDKSCHTDDSELERAYLHFMEQVDPKVKPLFFRLQKKLLDSPGGRQLAGPRYALLIKHWVTEAAIFRDENVPLDTEVTRLTNEYDKLCGAVTVEFRGREYTLPQLSRFLEEPERETRRAAWEAIVDRRLRDRDAIDAIFDQMLPLRDAMARNAGTGDFRAFMWKTYKRFDYTPDDCLAFADAVAQTCVPLQRELDRQRQRDLGIDRLRPWDMQVDPKHRPPLRPFDEANVTGLIDGVKSILARLSPQLADEFESLRARDSLDLQSRKGKQPGGYLAWLEESREPFIFMNAAGQHEDVVTLLHEGGHALHFLASAAEPLIFLRGAPVEFLEVASIGMEMLGSDHFDVFYPPADLARARRMQLQRALGLLTWAAVIDSFQHWLYTHPGHTRAQRTAEWLRLQDRFGNNVDWSGFEAFRAASWQRQIHLFQCPFYYIEYAIAQLGALQLWLKAKHDPHGALAGYRAALALAGTRSLPDLFTAAGLAFDFSAKTLRPLVAALRDELAALPP